MSLMSLMRWRDGRWRDEMNWAKARQGRRDKPKGEKGNEKKGNKRTTVLVTCLHSVSSPKTFFFFGLVLLLAFFSRAG